VRPADFLDIAVIAVIIYFALLWLRQQASRSVAVAIAAVGALYLLARQTDMYLTSQLFKAGFTAALVALVLIFQQDIRRIFERLAAWKLFTSKHGILASSRSIDTLTESVAKCADDKVGALIVIRGREPLERHVRGGVFLGGKISAPLIYGLFNTQSPTHDGAVLIEGESIEKYGVYLPLSQNLAEGGPAGTRHAAGLGLSERTDAFVIIVSEERGTISIAEQGKLSIVTSAIDLKKRLQQFYQHVLPSGRLSRRTRWITRNLGTKSVSLLLACALWFFLAFRVTTVHRTFLVPIECRNLPAGFIIDDPGVAEARVSLTGPERFFPADPSFMTVAVDLSALHNGTQDIPLTEQCLINKPSGLIVNQVMPRSIRMRAYHMQEISLPVKVVCAGSLPRNLGLAGVKADPETLRILVPASRKADYSELKTEPLSLGDIRRSDQVRLNVVLPDHAQFVDGKQASVLAKIEVTEKMRKN
jgi:uncharacterized protein (TIGR00159 family)